MRRRRWRWIVVGVLVFVGLYVAADIVMLQYLESRGSGELVRTVSAEEAGVDLGGFPFIPRFLRGRLNDVSITVQGASGRGGLRVQSIDVRMDELRFIPGELFALARSSFSTRTKVTATQPFGIQELAEQDLEDFLRRTIPLVGDVRIKGSGVEVRFFKTAALLARAEQPTDDNLTKPARYLPTIVDGRLGLTLIGVSQIPPIARDEARRLEGLLDLPKVPGGLQSDVSLRDAVIVIEAQGSTVTVTVGEGEPS